MTYANTTGQPGDWPNKRRRPRHPTLPRLYSRTLLKQVLLQTALLLLLIEAIFLAEKFNEVLDAAIRRGASFLDILILIAFRSPEIFDLALPLALLIALYRVALQSRELGEFLTISGLGIGVVQYLRLAIGLGFIAMLVSLFISGFVDPLARFEQRRFHFDLQYNTTQGTFRPGILYLFERFAVYVHPRPVDVLKPPTFIYERTDIEASSFRAFDAREARIEGPDEDGTLTLALREFTMADFKPDSPDKLREAGPAMMRVGTFQQAFKLDDLVKFEPRGYVIEELNLYDLGNLAFDGGPWTTRHTNEVGRRVARGLLCLMAPLMAMLALGFTDRRTRSFVLPIACAGIMIVDLTWAAIAETFAGSGLLLMLAILALNAVMLGGSLFLLSRGRELHIIKPALARS